MAVNDITYYENAAFGYAGDMEFSVTLGAVASINPGEPVVITLGLGGSNSSYVSAMATSKPVVGTDYLVGVSESYSTDTVAAAGTVKVGKLTPGVSYLIAPAVAATWNTQAKYDALVNAHVTLDLTTGVYTINATNSTNNGCVVLPLDISKYPGKVRFAFRTSVGFLN